MSRTIKRCRFRTVAGFLLSVLSAGFLAATPASEAFAQAFPSKPVRILIPSAPGAPSDVVVRLLAPRFAESWGQSVVAENRAGATGLIAIEMVAKAPADGHTMMLMTGTQMTSTLMRQKYLLGSEFAPIGMVGSTPLAIAIDASLPVSRLADWFAYVKSRPGKLTYGSGGAWGTLHLCMESINELAGIQMVHVPYTSAPAAYNATLGGQVQAYCAAGPTVMTIAKQGKLRLLAVTSLLPSRLVPDLPPVSSILPGYEIAGWLAMGTTRGTPADAINRISADMIRILNTPEITGRMMAMFIEPQPSNPAELAAFLQRESDRWGKFLKDRNARPED